MLAQSELGGSFYVDTAAPKVWDDKVPKNRSLKQYGKQTKLDQFLDDHTVMDDEVEEKMDDQECQRMMAKVLRHDLLNKLMVAQGGLELFDRSREDKFLDMARRNLEACGEILSKMSSLEKSPGPTKLTPTEVSGVAERVIRGHQGRGVELRVQGQGWAMVDGALFHVLDNLVSNAIRHAEPNNVGINIEEQGRKVLIKVADDGAGIPAEARGMLFQEGFKFGPNGNTGLGLYIVRQILKRYRGKIWIEDNVPHGTVFCVELNRAK